MESITIKKRDIEVIRAKARKESHNVYIAYDKEIDAINKIISEKTKNSSIFLDLAGGAPFYQETEFPHTLKLSENVINKDGFTETEYFNLTNCKLPYRPYDNILDIYEDKVWIYSQVGNISSQRGANPRPSNMVTCVTTKSDVKLIIEE